MARIITPVVLFIITVLTLPNGVDCINAYNTGQVLTNSLPLSYSRTLLNGCVIKWQGENLALEQWCLGLSTKHSALGRDRCYINKE